MLNQRNAAAHAAVRGDVEKLYLAAFPANERRPLDDLLNDPSGHGETIAFYDGDAFVGFVCLLTAGDIVHVIYFAIAENLRGRGFGGEVLALVRGQRPGMRVIADLEAQSPDAPNAGERARRRAFYMRNGFAPTGVAYAWRGEEYEILCAGGRLTDAEFWRFWETIEHDNHALGKY